MSLLRKVMLERRKHIPNRPELNRKIKEQFSEYIKEFLDFERYLSQDDESMIANFGTFMDGYEE